MSSSFEKINYSLRPNKSIERKMMCEAFNRLTLLDQLSNYRYIGMGSAYFADFILFHKTLGIHDLVSIEKEAAKKARFEFNKPFSCIDIKYGNSSTILPNLGLEQKKNIVWLDYDDKISDFMFADIDTFFINSAAGSLFLLSVNVEEDYLPQKAGVEQNPSQKEYRRDEMLRRVGYERLPNEFIDWNFTTKNRTFASFEMIRRQIDTTLITRNISTKDKVTYKQLFNFIYSDNATILTVGGIIYDESQKDKVNEMAFSSLDFICEKEDSYRISAPNLTLREIKALDKALPDKDNITMEKGKFKNKKLQEIPVIQTDIQSYAKIYRYYPNFAEALI
ncbi:MAG: O-methyltransferase [Bacteroidota bacterium]